VKPTLRTLYWWLLGLVLALLVYILSSGPVLAASFWLREATGWDGWYASIYLYLPLFALGHNNPIDWYIEFWVRLLGTVGPG
jgi:hypothetical protein